LTAHWLHAAMRQSATRIDTATAPCPLHIEHGPGFGNKMVTTLAMRAQHVYNAIASQLKRFVLDFKLF
jgi:hypothetical protein